MNCATDVDWSEVSPKNKGDDQTLRGEGPSKAQFSDGEEVDASDGVEDPCLLLLKAGAGPIQPHVAALESSKGQRLPRKSDLGTGLQACDAGREAEVVPAGG